MPSTRSAATPRRASGLIVLAPAPSSLAAQNLGPSTGTPRACWSSSRFSEIDPRASQPSRMSPKGRSVKLAPDDLEGDGCRQRNGPISRL